MAAEPTSSEVVRGETIWHVYCDSLCRWDFHDVRFALTGSTTAYTHKICSKTDGDVATFIVKVSETLDSNREIQYYFGNQNASDVSSDDALVIPPIEGVEGAWTMDEGSGGTFADSSGHGYTGTITSATWVTGKFGGALNFTATDDYVHFTTLNVKTVFNTKDITLVCSFKFTGGAGTRRTIIGPATTPRFYVEIRETNVIRIGMAGASWSTTFTPTIDTWYTLIVTRELSTGKLSYYIYYAVGNATDSSTNANYSTDLPDGDLMLSYGNPQCFVGVIDNVQCYDYLLSGTQIGNVGANFGDPALEAGKVLVRKHASTTVPTDNGTEGSGVETRASFGVQSLYPSQADLNFTVDRVLKKASVEFYLENTAEESAAATVLFDDSITDWIADAEVTWTEDSTVKIKGAKSGKMVFAADANNKGVMKTYSPTLDWSTQDFTSIFVYGSNSGGQFRILIASAPNWYTNYYTWNYTDNWIGWKRLVCPLKNASEEAGTLDLAAIKYVRVYSHGVGMVNLTLYIDRVVVDIGVWAKKEISTPDTLVASSNIALYAYDSDAEDYRADPFLTDAAYDEAELEFLDETLQSQILAAGKGAAIYAKAKRGETVSVSVGDADAGDTTLKTDVYSTKYRVAIAVKMPPADGQASASTGIGQCKLKAEVYYA